MLDKHRSARNVDHIELPFSGAVVQKLAAPYLLIPNALTPSDIQFLRNACKQYLAAEGIPCYVLLNSLEEETCLKIREAVEREVGEPLFYLNDFYMYTDGSFRTSWHMDTELFSFERAINAWVLLSPDQVCDPMGFIDGINDSPERSFHSVRIQHDQCTFGNYLNGETLERPLARIEAEQVRTPEISLGDILVINPMRFHKTNTLQPKHAIVFKFVMKGQNGFLSASQVNPFFWPEVGIFNNLVKNAADWDAVLSGIRHALSSEPGRSALCAGFYPDKFPMYKRMAAGLPVMGLTR